MTNEEAVKVLEDMIVKISIPKAAELQRKRNEAIDMAIEVLNSSEIPNSLDTISRQAAIDAFDKRFDSIPIEQTTEALLFRKDLRQLPPAEPEEVIPHRNYKYLSDYWCECGWHLGKKGEVKYCSDCGRKVNWNG